MFVIILLTLEVAKIFLPKDGGQIEASDFTKSIIVVDQRFGHTKMTKQCHIPFSINIYKVEAMCDIST